MYLFSYFLMNEFHSFDLHSFRVFDKLDRACIEHFRFLCSRDLSKQDVGGYV
jgi:hypothetical protein